MSSLEDWKNWRGRTRGGIPYRVMTRTGEHEYTKSTVTEVYVIRAIHLGLFLFESFPIAAQVFDEPTYNPRLLPGVPSAARMATRRITWEPLVEGLPVDPFLVDRFASLETYGRYLKVTITYDNDYDKKTPKKGPDPYTYLEIKGDASGQFLSVPCAGNSAYLSPNDELSANRDELKRPNTDASATMHILVPETTWTVTWRGVRYKFWTDVLLPNIRATLGNCNSAACPWLYDAPPETVLFTGYNFSEEYASHSLNTPGITFDTADPDGNGSIYEDPDPDLQPSNLERISDVVTVEFKFLERSLVWGSTQVTHNHEWRVATGQWERVYPNGTDPLYFTMDLNQLFNVAVINENEAENA